MQVGDPALSVQISFSNRHESFLNHNQEDVDAYFATNYDGKISFV